MKLTPARRKALEWFRDNDGAKMFPIGITKRVTRELPDLVIARPNGSRLAFVGRDDFVAARQFVKEHGK